MANTKRNSGRRASKYEAPKQRRITKKQIENATYKDVKLLEKFVSDRGKIRSSLITGITKQEQAKVARLIKVARELAYCLMLQQALISKAMVEDEINS
jgi:small subunit ribosomal protein S18